MILLFLALYLFDLVQGTMNMELTLCPPEAYDVRIHIHFLGFIHGTNFACLHDSVFMHIHVFPEIT